MRTDPPSLSAALRERTAALHVTAERSGIVNDLLSRKADRRSYAMLLRNLLPAYCEMESALESHVESPVFKVFAAPGIRRMDRIIADLTALCGADWRDLTLLPAAERYAARVSLAAEGDGIRLIAHAYVRYFGDLSGGQVLKRLLGTSLGLGADALSLYDFPEISDPAAFKEQMRDAIDRAGANREDFEMIVDEGIVAFEQNIDVSRAVQAWANVPA